MTDVSEQDRREAEKLFNEWRKDEKACATTLIRLIARAIAEARKGEVRVVRIAESYHEGKSYNGFRLQPGQCLAIIERSSDVR